MGNNNSLIECYRELIDFKKQINEVEFNQVIGFNGSSLDVYCFILDFINKELFDNTDLKVLELGFGNGVFLEYLSSQDKYVNMQISGIEMLDNAFKIEHSSQVELIKYDFREYSTESKFDIIYAINFFHRDLLFEEDLVRIYGQKIKDWLSSVFLSASKNLKIGGYFLFNYEFNIDSKFYAEFFVKKYEISKLKYPRNIIVLQRVK